MKEKPANLVEAFYSGSGWKATNGVTEDAKEWEDLRACAQKYISKCRLRILRYLPPRGERLLDMASGPIQYPDYLKYSENFKKRYCVDLSQQALEDARAKIGDHGVFLQGNFLDIPFEDNFFDCTISLHTIYHIDKDDQEAAITKLIKITKPGSPIIIVYANPHSIPAHLITLAMLFKRILSRCAVQRPQRPKLYFFAFPLKWWKKFNALADVKIMPWRSLPSRQQRLLIPDNKVGERILDLLFTMEEKFPTFFKKLFYYPIIILIKKP